jgi:hypothetical protein
VDRYFTRSDIKAIIAGVSDTTLDRWSKHLRGTWMVKKLRGRMLFSESFLVFVRSRTESLGPANLPDPERIAELYRVWNLHRSVQAISKELGEAPVLVQAQLESVGLREAIHATRS